MTNGAVSDTLSLLAAKHDSSSGLFPTDETPGDDEVEYPYHFSSHVLLWYTLHQVALLLDALGPLPDFSGERLKALADDVRTAALKHFVVAGDRKSVV